MTRMRTVTVGAVAAVAVAVPAVAATGGSGGAPTGGAAPRNPSPPLCQAGAAQRLKLSSTQADGVSKACDTLTSKVAAADRAYQVKVATLASGDQAGLWQARQERRTAVWSARDAFQQTVHDTLGIARQGLGPGQPAPGQGQAALGAGRWGRGGGMGRHGAGGMGQHRPCPYARS